MRRKLISTQKLLVTVFLCFSVPAALLLLSFSFYTVNRQTQAETQVYKDALLAYGSNLEMAITNSNTQISYIVHTNPEFQLFSYSDTTYKKHIYANELIKYLKLVQNQEIFVGSYFLYSSSPEYYAPLWNTSYSYNDNQTLKHFLSNASRLDELQNRWLPLELSTRLVYINISGIKTNLFAVVIDPAQYMILNDFSNSNKDTYLFFTTENGDSFYPRNILESWEGTWNEEALQKGTYNNKPYRLIKSPVGNTGLYLCCLAPHKNMWQVLNAPEEIIILLIFVFIFSVPFLWVVLYQQLLHPLKTLTECIKKIAQGTESPRVPEDQPIAELRTFSHTLNHALENIQRLKLESYEQKLDLQQAQLQYLHLQIRPHFYINCLKNIYSLAETKKYEQIQEMILSLSDYFRYVFRDSRKLISLNEELHSIKAYVALQKINYAYDINLTMQIAVDTPEILILPLSVLTFVENCIKHSHSHTKLNIHLESSILQTGKEDFLNIIVHDNGGGFSEKDLEYLNHISRYKTLYDDYHVGISNIYYRMKLMYGNKSMLYFYNHENGSCVEITVPIKGGE